MLLVSYDYGREGNVILCILFRAFNAFDNRAVCIYLRITCDSVILSTKNWVVAVFICMRTCSLKTHSYVNHIL